MRLLLMSIVLFHFCSLSPLLQLATSSENRSESSGIPTWNKIQEKLCPHMTPNPRAWIKIFELARQELGLSDADIHIKDKAEEDAVTLFFKFNAGGYVFTTTLEDNPHHMIYLKMYKCGSTHIIENLMSWYNTQLKGNVIPSSFFPTSDVYKNAQLQRTLYANNACVVTALREPVDHFLSAYNEVMHRRRTRYRRNRISRVQNETTLQLQFEQFVINFINEPQHSYNGRMEELEMTHVYSMSGSLRGLKRLQQCHGNHHAPNITAYLPSAQNLNLEFPEMMKRHCPLIPKLDVFAAQTSQASRLDQYNYHASARTVWMEGGAVSRALCIIHVMDYFCWDVPVPAFCEGVFEGEVFRKALAKAATVGQSWDDSDPCSRDFPAM